MEAGYLNNNVTVELIADGKHAAVHALQLALKIKGTDRIALVTDGVRPAGTDVTESYFGKNCLKTKLLLKMV